MDTALKQRLIGAAVLVALAVIFLPMLLEGPAPDGGASHVPLEMPAPADRRFETRELPLVPPTPVGDAAPAAPAADPDDPNRIVTVDADDAPRQDALADDPATAPVDLTARVTAPAPATPQPQPQSAAPAPAAPAPTPPAAEMLHAAQAGGRYVVNLGSYTNQANARALVDALKASQLPAYAEEVTIGSQRGLRVRVGPYEQRASAESARLRALRVRDDVPATVVALDAATPAPSQAAAGGVAAGFAVQVGAFRTEADAIALRDRLRNGGFVAFSERVQTESGTLYRVRVGPEPDRAAAERLRDRVNERFRLNGMVVAHP
ncbi:SPOR domain-containing protein [Rehaibacterium terrae]|jgi:DedD protein|uniref:DedD protein n=1 Tax=Rehaibacterium terrae TaxID=1341696 RepID=A0A7W8DEZ1_9GAMM|nr:SPOR domain-containing protein [Rehaibacterium terrae]MBB5015814.1 DedD protein [Rehaibacterium terrae]